MSESDYESDSDTSQDQIINLFRHRNQNIDIQAQAQGSQITRQVFKKLKQLISCPICLNILQKPVYSVKCYHRFCKDCIEKSIRLQGDSKLCPVCRKDIGCKRKFKIDKNIVEISTILLGNVEQYIRKQEEIERKELDYRKRFLKKHAPAPLKTRHKAQRTTLYIEISSDDEHDEYISNSNMVKKRHLNPSQERFSHPEETATNYADSSNYQKQLDCVKTQFQQLISVYPEDMFNNSHQIPINLLEANLVKELSKLREVKYEQNGVRTWKTTLLHYDAATDKLVIKQIDGNDSKEQSQNIQSQLQSNEIIENNRSVNLDQYSISGFRCEICTEIIPDLEINQHISSCYYGVRETSNLSQQDDNQQIQEEIDQQIQEGNQSCSKFTEIDENHSNIKSDVLIQTNI